MHRSGAQGGGLCNFPKIIIFSPRKDGFSPLHIKIHRILVNKLKNECLNFSFLLLQKKEMGFLSLTREPRKYDVISKPLGG